MCVWTPGECDNQQVITVLPYLPVTEYNLRFVVEIRKNQSAGRSFHYTTVVFWACRLDRTPQCRDIARTEPRRTGMTFNYFHEKSIFLEKRSSEYL